MISQEELRDILADGDPLFIENLAREARQITIRNFGEVISLYAPVYLANFCDNRCVYCGFNQRRDIPRKKLTRDEMHKEMKKVADTGIQSVLLLTGGSRSKTPPAYLLEAVAVAEEYFPFTGLEVYPLLEEEYRELFLAGVDGVTIYQETYDRERYRELHLSGEKADYDYRYQTPERIAAAGIRAITMGVLLGLSEIAEDAYRLFLHLDWMEKHFPGVEYALSFPRLIPPAASAGNYFPVSDAVLIKLICLSRILFPRVGINLSTRENANLRDHALKLGVTRMSAASRTSVGGYTAVGNCESPQFQVQDDRSVREIVELLERQGYDPIFTDWRRIVNTAI